MTRVSSIALTILFLVSIAFAQDKQELEAERKAGQKLKGEHPLVNLMKTKTSSLKNELVGVHPRVFLTQAEIDALKDKTRSQKELWQTAISRVRAMSVEPPPPPAETRRAQNEVGLGIVPPDASTRLYRNLVGRCGQAVAAAADAAVMVVCGVPITLKGDPEK